MIHFVLFLILIAFTPCHFMMSAAGIPPKKSAFHAVSSRPRTISSPPEESLSEGDPSKKSLYDQCLKLLTDFGIPYQEGAEEEKLFKRKDDFIAVLSQHEITVEELSLINSMFLAVIMHEELLPDSLSEIRAILDDLEDDVTERKTSEQDDEWEVEDIE